MGAWLLVGASVAEASVVVVAAAVTVVVAAAVVAAVAAAADLVVAVVDAAAAAAAADVAAADPAAAVADAAAVVAAVPEDGVRVGPHYFGRSRQKSVLLPSGCRSSSQVNPLCGPALVSYVYCVFSLL